MGGVWACAWTELAKVLLLAEATVVLEAVPDSMAPASTALGIVGKPPLSLF